VKPTYDPLILLRRVGFALALWLVLVVADRQLSLGLDSTVQALLSAIVAAVAADLDAWKATPPSSEDAPDA